MKLKLPSPRATVRRARAYTREHKWFTRITIGAVVTQLILGVLYYPGLVPATSAAEVAIDASVSTAGVEHAGTGAGTVWVSDTNGYMFYVDSGGDCVYSATTNSGASWSAATQFDTQTDCFGISVWYDRWTPGDTTGTYIHISWLDASADGVYYNRLDTSGNTLWIAAGSPMDISGSTTPAFVSDEFSTITKGTDGDLYIGASEATDSAVFKCTGTCNSSGNWPEAASGTNPFNAQDMNIQLIPQASGDIMAIQHDRSLEDLQSKIYSDSGNTWAGSWTTIDANAFNLGTPYYGTFSATLDIVTYDVYIVYGSDNVGNNVDLRTALYSGGSWTSKTTIIDNYDEESSLTMWSIALNQNNGDVYVAYAHRDGTNVSTTATVHYVKSTNRMQSWSNESAAINASADEVFGVHLNMMSDQRIYVTWYEAVPDDIFGETLADLTPTTVAQSGYRMFDGGNTVGSTWWNSSWLNRRKVTIDNTSSTENLTEFAVRVSLTDPTTIEYDNTKTNGEDIRFVDSDNTTVLKHEIERWNESGTSEVWVKVPQIDANSAGDYFWMYYNNTGASDGQDAANVWDTATKAVYHMNFNPAPATSPNGCDAGTKELCDSTSNNNDGDSNGTMTSGDLVTGGNCIDRCIDFDGSDDYFEIPDHSSLDITSTITISGWGTYNNTASWRTMINKETSFSAANYALQVTNTPEVVFSHYDGGYIEYMSPNKPTSGSSYFLAATFTTTGDQACIYQNGSRTYCQSSTQALNANNQSLILGESPADEQWTGYMDEVRIVSGIRSPEWMEAEYLTGSNNYLSYGAEETNINAALTALAAANTAATASNAADKFRLRMLLHFGGDGLRTGLTNFKLQYAPKSGTCDTGYSGETYVDVGSGDVKFNDIPTPSDGAQINSGSTDPTYSSNPNLPQTLEESSTFTNLTKIYANQEGLWDFSLIDTSHTAGNNYCFRVVKSDGSAIATPLQVPELVQPGINQMMRHGNYFGGNIEEGSIW